MKLGIEFSRKLSLAYESMCKPLCHELKLPQTAFDILMFLANNPEFKTARDIVEVRKLKANLVSVNIDKLVNEGYLIRKNVEGDRRKFSFSVPIRHSLSSAEASSCRNTLLNSFLQTSTMPHVKSYSRACSKWNSI